MTERLLNKPCRVCGKLDADKPMAFVGEDWCSDDHRKVVMREKLPTDAELSSMDDDLFHYLTNGVGIRCGGEGGDDRSRATSD